MMRVKSSDIAKHQNLSKYQKDHIDGSWGCCGLDFLHDIWDTKPELVIRYVVNTYCSGENWHTDKFHPVPFIVFSYTKEQANYGTASRLVTYIKDHKLGKVHKTQYRRNPNSGNLLLACLWEVDPRGIIDWQKEHPTRSRRRV